MMTLPTTTKGTALVSLQAKASKSTTFTIGRVFFVIPPSRTPECRSATTPTTSGVADAYVESRWVSCCSEHYEFFARSEWEMMSWLRQNCIAGRESIPATCSLPPEGWPTSWLPSRLKNRFLCSVFGMPRPSTFIGLQASARLNWEATPLHQTMPAQIPARERWCRARPNSSRSIETCPTVAFPEPCWTNRPKHEWLTFGHSRWPILSSKRLT